MISNARLELRGKNHETIKLTEESLNKVGSVCPSLGDEGIFLSSEHRTLARLPSVGGSWNKNDCHRFIYLNALGVALFDRIRRGGFAGGNASLEVGFGGSKAQVRPSGSLFLLPVDLDVEF